MFTIIVLHVLNNINKHALFCLRFSIIRIILCVHNACKINFGSVELPICNLRSYSSDRMVCCNVCSIRCIHGEFDVPVNCAHVHYLDVTNFTCIVKLQRQKLSLSKSLLIPSISTRYFNSMNAMDVKLSRCVARMNLVVLISLISRKRIRFLWEPKIANTDIFL